MARPTAPGSRSCRGASAAFTSDYDPAEIFEMAAKLQKKM